MNYPEKELNERVKEIRRKAERMLKKGLLGEGSSRLEKTLEMHEHLKILLEELNFTLAEEDISEEIINEKISEIEKELKELEF